MLGSGTGGVHRRHARTLLTALLSCLPFLSLSLVEQPLTRCLMSSSSPALALPLLLSRGLDGHGRVLIMILILIVIMVMEMHSMNIMMVMATR